VREAAVRGLAGSRDGRAIPYVLLRLNDWVRPVQTAAREAIEEFFQPPFAPDVIAALPIVWALARRTRADHEALISRVFAFLRSPACVAAVRAGCGAPDRDIRRDCLELLLRSPGGQGDEEAQAVLGAALADRDPAVRLWAARELARALPARWAEELARGALADRSVQVRRAALGVVAPSLSDDEARPLLEAALLDTHTTARWQARVLVLARGPFDLAAFYRRVLAAAKKPALVRGALLGLGESGTAVDIARVVPFLSADRLRVRCAALRARADLEPLSATEPYLAALRSAEPGMSREARRALEPRLSHVAVSILHEIVADQALPPHARRNALSLAYGKSKWERLPVLLDGCADSDEMIAKMALRLVDGWCAGYNRSFLQPTPAQVEAASGSFARVSSRLRAHTRAEVGHILTALRRS
jgi:HEAT repeat protein